MIDTTFVRVMARYNRWQNDSLYAAADTLSDEARRQDRGAFFKSIQGTLNHLLWADSMWMSRLGGDPRPEVKLADSPSFIADWEGLKRERAAIDERIIAWAEALEPSALAGDLIWRSGILQTEVTRPRWLVVTHFFNHQTHHRGQAHDLITAAGAKPQDTDLILLQG